MGAILIAALFAAVACGQNAAQPATEPEDANMSASAGEGMQPEAAMPGDDMATDEQKRPQLTGFTARDLDGNTVTEAAFQNADVTMVNVWATYCGPCLQEMPSLGEIASEYADKGFQIIGVVSDVGESDEDAKSVREITDKTGANYAHLLPSQSLADQLLSGMMYVPTTVFLDKDGYLLGQAVVGSKSKAEWKSIIDDMLELAAAGSDMTAG